MVNAMVLAKVAWTFYFGDVSGELILSEGECEVVAIGSTEEGRALMYHAAGATASSPRTTTPGPFGSTKFGEWTCAPSTATALPEGQALDPGADGIPLDHELELLL